MADRDLSALLADPARAADVPVDAIPQVLGELEQLKAALWVRLTSAAPSIL